MVDNPVMGDELVTEEIITQGAAVVWQAFHHLSESIADALRRVSGDAIECPGADVPRASEDTAKPKTSEDNDTSDALAEAQLLRLAVEAHGLVGRAVVALRRVDEARHGVAELRALRRGRRVRRIAVARDSPRDHVLVARQVAAQRLAGRAGPPAGRDPRPPPVLRRAVVVVVAVAVAVRALASVRSIQTSTKMPMSGKPIFCHSLGDYERNALQSTPPHAVPRNTRSNRSARSRSNKQRTGTGMGGTKPRRVAICP